MINENKDTEQNTIKKNNPVSFAYFVYAFYPSFINWYSSSLIYILYWEKSYSWVFGKDIIKYYEAYDSL